MLKPCHPEYTPACILPFCFLMLVSPVVSVPVAKTFASSCSKLANDNHVVSLLTHRAGHFYSLHCYYICLVKKAHYITHA